MTSRLPPSPQARLKLGLLVVAHAVLLAACAGVQAPREQIVRERAQARWDAMLAGDWQKAYGYLSPGSRAVTSFDAWRNSLPRATVWKGAEVQAVDCPVLDRCNIRVNIHHQPLINGGRFGTIASAIDEVWLVDDGKWWLLHAR